MPQPPRLVRQQVLRLKPLLPRERLGAAPGQQRVRRPLGHAAGDRHGVDKAAHVAHRAADGGRDHDGRVERDGPVAVGQPADADRRVRQIALRVPCGGLGGVERGSAGSEVCPRRLHGGQPESPGGEQHGAMGHGVG